MNPITINAIPIMIICLVTLPLSGRTNCGKKAIKNNETFGELLTGSVSGAVITNAGSGYSVGTNLAFSGGQGTNLTAQVILYREFFAKQFGIEPDKIDVEYFIVKRRVT